MKIEQKRINCATVIKILVIIFTIILTAIINCLVTTVIMKGDKYSDFNCEDLTGKIRRGQTTELRQLDWWENAIVYQIYVRSFKDSDGDGIGDLRGLASKLDHFVDAGVEVVWLSPIFTSPMDDFGYDISNFYDIHYEYGTMADFEEMIEKAHQLGIKVLIDYVANHASIESQYFKLSEARVPGYEDFFIWVDPKPDPNNASNRLIPNNWLSDFGGPIWSWNEARQQYYLHQFSKSQADFNFRLPAVRRELINIIRFWLEKGSDGFRIDALPHLYEVTPDENGVYPDELITGNMFLSPYDVGYTDRRFTKDLGEVYDDVYEWRDFVDDFQNKTGGGTRLLLAEAYANISSTMRYYGEDGRNGVHFPFNFDFIRKLTASASARDYVYIIQHWLSYLPYGRVANWVFANHDNPRMATRFGDHMVDGLNALSMILPGVSCAYQGDEIGMHNGQVSWDETTDVKALKHGTKNNYKELSRDPERTPFLWDSTTSAGFSTNKTTWLPVNGNYTINNLEVQKKAERSHYKVYQALAKLRKNPALSHGDYDLHAITENTLILVRYLDKSDKYAMVFNVGKVDDTVDLSRNRMLKEPMIVYTSSVHSRRKPGDGIPLGDVTLQAGEVLVLQLPKCN